MEDVTKRTLPPELWGLWGQYNIQRKAVLKYVEAGKTPSDGMLQTLSRFWEEFEKARIELAEKRDREMRARVSAKQARETLDALHQNGGG